MSEPNITQDFTQRLDKVIQEKLAFVGGVVLAGAVVIGGFYYWGRKKK